VQAAIACQLDTQQAVHGGLRLWQEGRQQADAALLGQHTGRAGSAQQLQVRWPQFAAGAVCSSRSALPPVALLRYTML
jgi:hypothetical protein